MATEVWLIWSVVADIDRYARTRSGRLRISARVARKICVEDCADGANKVPFGFGYRQFAAGTLYQAASDEVIDAGEFGGEIAGIPVMRRTPLL